VEVGLDLRLDGRVLGFAVVAAALAGLLASLLPAFQASAPDLVPALKGDAAVSRGLAGRWTLRDALVTGQMALTVVLVVVAGLLLRSLGASQRAEVGFRPAGLTVLSFDTDMVRYSPERCIQFWEQTLARVRTLPGLVSAATASTMPFEFNFNTTSLQIDTRSYPDNTRGEVIETRAVSAGYFETLGIQLLEGRDFQDSERQDGPMVAVINQTMARQFWAGDSALGHTVRNPATNTVYEIVGVVADHKNHGVLEADAPFLHFAASQAPRRYRTLVARASGDAGQLLAAIRRELLQQEPGLVFMANGTVAENMAASLLPARVGAWLATGFGALGTLLAAIGLYGVIAFSVTRRTREIGVRMAIGARPGRVLSMVLRQGFVLTGVGLAIGGALAAGAAVTLSGLLYGISPADPLAWSLAIVVLLLAAALANLVPARRAMRVDPMTALRTE
jgi:predicted permease